MRTSAPGSRRPGPRRARRAGFTLIEVMVVVALVAIAVSVASLALRDPARERLEREATRLAALLEMARAESRATAWPVSWAVGADPNDPATLRFRFVGLTDAGLQGIAADRFLDPAVRVQVVVAGIAAAAVRLGPEAILPPQRVLLSLGDRQLEVSSDGITAFSVLEPASKATP